MGVSEKASGRPRARESSGQGDGEEKGLCTATTGKTNFAIGQSLNGLKLLLSFICIYLQLESVPFTVLGEILTELKIYKRNNLSYIDFSISETVTLISTSTSNIGMLSVFKCVAYLCQY